MSTTDGSVPRLRALRGATTVEKNAAPDIVEETSRLLRAMFERNGIEVADVVSVVFTATADLSAEFPAVGARALGLTHVPLLCAREIEVPGALERCIRVLVHLYTSQPPSELVHVYLNRAHSLRSDLSYGHVDE